MKAELCKLKLYYQPMIVEQKQWYITTGVSLPIGTTGFGNEVETEVRDFMTRGEQ